MARSAVGIRRQVHWRRVAVAALVGALLLGAWLHWALRPERSLEPAPVTDDQALQMSLGVPAVPR
jgi:hypothetical protein